MSGPARDPTKFDTEMVARLDKLYASPQAVAQRMRFRELLAARKGEIGADVGCGLGHLSCELARDVLPGGRIIGLDSSREMVDAANLRIEKEKLSDFVQARICNAVALDLPEDSTDFVAAVQVYSYVQDVTTAVQEAARVLRKGGRLAVLETDWDMCIYESNDPALMRRVLDGRWRFAHSSLPRQLHRLLRQSGLRLERCEAFPIVETQFEAGSFGVGLAAIAKEAAVRHGVSSEDADRWATDIHSRSQDGDYFFCTVRFIFIATK